MINRNLIILLSVASSLAFSSLLYAASSDVTSEADEAALAAKTAKLEQRPPMVTLSGLESGVTALVIGTV